MTMKLYPCCTKRVVSRQKQQLAALAKEGNGSGWGQTKGQAAFAYRNCMLLVRQASEQVSDLSVSVQADQ